MKENPTDKGSFISGSGVGRRTSLNEREHQVISSAFTLEPIFAYLHPRVLCAAMRVNSTWCAVAYAQRALFRDWDVEECLRSAHSRDVLHPRFGRLRRMVVPASFVKSHGTPTHCIACFRPLPVVVDYPLKLACRCADPKVITTRKDSEDYFRFSELQSLSLCIPPRYCIDPSALSPLTTLTSLSIENLNPACAAAYGALVTQSPHLRALTYLTRFDVRMLDNERHFPFSFADLSLERLEVNQIDFEDIVHMASTLKSLKIAGYGLQDQYRTPDCVRFERLISQLGELETMDISGLDSSEIRGTPRWMIRWVCMLSNLQRLEVGPIFSRNDFQWVVRDMVSLRALGIHNNPVFATSLQNFTAYFSSTLTSLTLRNCFEALADPAYLASLAALRALHIEQDPPHGGTLRKLVPTVERMTGLVDLALVGLSINPVTLYPKLTQLQRLVLNFTPTSDADMLIIRRKLPALRHLGLQGYNHVTLQGLLGLLACVHLRVLEWDEPTRAQRAALLAACPDLCLISPKLKEQLEPLIPGLPAMVP